MSRLRHQRVRLLLAVALLLIIGVAGYQIGVSVWTSRKYAAACEALERYDYPRKITYPFIQPTRRLLLIDRFRP
jgi:hypothetical protein